MRTWINDRIAGIKWRYLVADTAARVTFSVVTGMVIELSAGMTITESLVSRAISQPLTALTARPYGWLRDKVLCCCGITKKQWVWWSILNILTYAFFYCPQYALSLYIIGVDTKPILIATSTLGAASLLLGILFGLWLDLVRRIFKIKPNEKTPKNQPAGPDRVPGA